jgi:beta-N-acetylhexosaminidase
MDLKGAKLSKQEITMLRNPQIYGVILVRQFKYGEPELGGNQYESVSQLQLLIKEIKTINPKLKICIDHEGGEVIRFKDERTDHKPYLGSYLEGANDKAIAAFNYADHVGKVLKEIGVDIILGPVADIKVKGTPLSNRAVSADPKEAVSILKSYAKGIKKHNISMVLKHYPGLGHIKADTHHSAGIIEEHDASETEIFHQLATSIDTVMIGHAIYNNLDTNTPASRSTKIARMAKQHFNTVITDDISMGGLGGSLRDNLAQIKDLGSIAIVMHSQDELYEILQSNQNTVCSQIFNLFSIMSGFFTQPVKASQLAMQAQIERTSHMTAPMTSRSEMYSPANFDECS